MKKMRKKIDWAKYLPLGIEPKSEFQWLALAHGLSIGFSLLFLWRYAQEYNELYSWYGSERALIEGVMMPQFMKLYEGCMAGFAVTVLSMPFLAAWHYGSHFAPTKSIYVMRRIPNRTEMPKRVWTIPLLTAFTSVLLFFLVTLVYLGIYYGCTPPQCLIPGQF